MFFLLPFSCTQVRTVSTCFITSTVQLSTDNCSGYQFHRRCADEATAGEKAGAFYFDIDRRVIVPLVLRPAARAGPHTVFERQGVIEIPTHMTPLG